MNKLGRTFLTSLLLSLFIGFATAQSPTQVVDTVKNTDGSLFNGTVAITWGGSSVANGTGAVPYSTSVKVYNGVLSVSLVPNASYSTVYVAVFNSSDGRISWVENWVVGPSSSPLTLSQVRTTLSSTSSSGATFSMGQISGLSAYLNALSSSLNTVSSTISGFNSSIAGLNNSVSSLTTRVNTLQSSVSTSAAGNVVEGETPLGSINGTNAVFTIANTPATPGSVAVFRNGILQSAGTDYSLSGKTITFASTSIPQGGDTLQASYRTGTAAQSAGFVDAEAPAGTINGTNLAFSLAATPVAGTLRLYKNGELLLSGFDYGVSGSAVTFLNATSTPVTGDSLVAYYRTSN